MLAMTALGVGEIIGAIAMGLIIDKIGPKYSSLVNLPLVVIQTGVVIAYIIIDRYSYFAFIMTFVWGLQDSSVNIHLD